MSEAVTANPPRAWLQAHLTVHRGQAPLIELLFERLGALSVTLADAADEPVFEPAPGETPLWEATRVTGLFAGETDADTLRNAIDQALGAAASRALRLEPLEDQVWERAWLDHFRPMRFGRRLWISPGDEGVEAADAVVLSLDPGLAFGTGTHPTTALCLEWLDAAALEGRRVIDYGCGSGILGIAALLLGAEAVVAVDHDPQALLATRDNAARNGVAGRLQVVHSEGFRPREADLVVANILANTLVELAPQIRRLVAPGGRLALSGILEAQAAEVAAAYTETLDFEPATGRDGWCLLSGRRRG